MWVSFLINLWRKIVILIYKPNTYFKIDGFL